MKLDIYVNLMYGCVNLSPQLKANEDERKLIRKWKHTPRPVRRLIVALLSIASMIEDD